MQVRYADDGWHSSSSLESVRYLLAVHPGSSFRDVLEGVIEGMADERCNILPRNGGQARDDSDIFQPFSVGHCAVLAQTRFGALGRCER